MKILLSAYACEPNKGSEPGVGWSWAVELARLGHEVWVLTRSNNRTGVETAVRALPERKKLHFLFYDLPNWAAFWKKGGRGVYLYYFLWQRGAYLLAKKAHAQENFDLVHHVTFVTVRQPSFMGKLGIPFIFGPVAGGESAPWRLRSGYGLRGWIREIARDAMNLLVRLDPFMWQTFRRADRIYVTSEQTKALVPVRFKDKTRLQLAIGCHFEEVAREEKLELHPFRILYVGRFVYWKGMHLGFAAFAQLLRQIPSARLTLVGQGPDEERWRKMVADMGIQDNVDWFPWVEQPELHSIYAEHDAFLFPSLHDSGGMVVLEAMAHGLPVVCLDLGGPGVMVNDGCGQIISTAGKDAKRVVDDLCHSLFTFALNDKLRNRCRWGAMKKVDEYRWQNIVRKIHRSLD